jgi:hypothetical protein
MENAKANSVAQKRGTRPTFEAKLERFALSLDDAFPPKGNRCHVATSGKLQGEIILALFHSFQFDYRQHRVPVSIADRTVNGAKHFDSCNLHWA